MLDSYLKMRGEEIDTQEIPGFLKRADFEYTMVPTLSTVHLFELDSSWYPEIFGGENGFELTTMQVDI